jgi:ribosomal protein L37E
MPDDMLFDRETVATILGLSPYRVGQLCREGAFPGARHVPVVGGGLEWGVPAAAVFDYRRELFREQEQRPDRRRKLPPACQRCGTAAEVVWRNEAAECASCGECLASLAREASGEVE